MSTDVVGRIAEALGEKEELPRRQIAEIVAVLGEEATEALVGETRALQDAGGLAVRDGTRRRTDGGVFFSLAKERLPRADRNRIFRVKPERPAPEEAPREASGDAPAAAPRAGADDRAALQQAGRRRVVEIEVVRTGLRAAPPQVEPRFVAPPVVAPAAPPPPVAEVRPARRIVAVAPKEEPPPTSPGAARERVVHALRALDREAQAEVLRSLLAELEPPPARSRRNVDAAEELRERVLASVTEALGLSSGDLARALYDDDGPTSRSRARVALERLRRGVAGG